MKLICTAHPHRSSATWIAYFLLSFLLVIAPWRGVASHADSQPNAGRESVEDPLVALNQAFRAAYACCRQSIVDQSGPIILVEGDDLVLLHKGKSTPAKVVPTLYHTLKTVCHVPLAVYVMLLREADHRLGDGSLTELRAYREKLIKAEAFLQSRGLSKESLARQEEITRATLSFLDCVLSHKRVDSDELTKFARGLKPQILANVAEAAHAELDGLDTQVRKWKAELTPDEWSKMHLIIMGSPLPRQGNLATQYFSRLLGEKGEGKRVIYAESIFDEARAVNLLGTHLLDTSIGAAFFADPERMHRDLLSDAAKEQLMKMRWNHGGE